MDSNGNATCNKRDHGNINLANGGFFAFGVVHHIERENMKEIREAKPHRLVPIRPQWSIRWCLYNVLQLRLSRLRSSDFLSVNFQQTEAF